MGNRFSRALLRGAALGAMVGIPALAHFLRRRRPPALGQLGYFKVSSLSIPKAASGPFRACVCLSPDERTVLVAGRPSIPPSKFDAMNRANSDSEFLALADWLSQTVFVAPWPPGAATDYRVVTEVPAVACVLAMAVSPVERVAAVLVREGWWNRIYPQAIVNRLDRTKPYCDVLYTVALDHGSLVPLAVLNRGRTPRETFPTLTPPMSICWHADGSAVYYRDEQGVFRTALDGKATKIRDLGDSRVFSPLVHKEGKLRYLSYPWMDARDGGLAADRVPKLIEVGDNGKVRELASLWPFAPDLGDSFFVAAIGDKQYAVINPCDVFAGCGSGYELDVLPLTSKFCRRERIDHDGAVRFRYDVCHFFSNDKEL